MLTAVRRLLVSPNRFFALEQADPGLREPILIVVLSGGIYGLSGLIEAFGALQRYQGEAVVYFYAGIAFSWLATVLTTLLFWVFYAGAFFVIAVLLFDADGEFRDLFALTGWGFIGQAFAGLVSVLSNVIENGILLGGTRAITASQAQMSFPLLVASVVGMLSFLWSAYLWNYAVQHTLYLPTRKSVVTVALPVLFSAVVFYASTLSSLPV